MCKKKLCYQPIWISDEAPRFVGLHLDPTLFAKAINDLQNSPSKFTVSGLRVKELNILDPRFALMFFFVETQLGYKTFHPFNILTHYGNV